MHTNTLQCAGMKNKQCSSCVRPESLELPKDVSALDLDSIHIDLTLQSTLYETGSIHFDRVRTTNLTRDDSCTRPNYGHVIDRAFVNKSSRSAEMLFWLLLSLLLRVRERNRQNRLARERSMRRRAGRRRKRLAEARRLQRYE